MIKLLNRLFSSLLMTALLVPFTSNAISVDVKLENEKGLPVGNIVVYLLPVDSAPPLPTVNSSIIIKQQNKAFQPQISVMRKGSDIQFINNDDITHQIYSPIGDNKFSFKIRSGEHYNQKQLSALGEVTMGCNIHDWMSGYLLVVDTPYFNITNETGLVNFDVTHQGKYELILWHPLFANRTHNISSIQNIAQDTKIVLNVNNKNIKLPIQKPTDNFDFLSDY